MIDAILLTIAAAIGFGAIGCVAGYQLRGWIDEAEDEEASDDQDNLYPSMRPRPKPSTPAPPSEPRRGGRPQ